MNKASVPTVKPMIEPAIISLKECLFKVSRAHAMRIVKNRQNIPRVRSIGIMRKDKKMLNETCNELLIK